MAHKILRYSYNIVKNLNIRKKIMYFYMTLIIISILLSMFIYNRTNTYYLNEKIKELTIDEIEADNRSLELLIEDINNYSKTLLASQTLHMELTGDKYGYISYKTIDREIAEFINFNNKVSSIYIFRSDGKKYYSEKEKLKNIQLHDIQATPWYKQLVNKKGGYLININANGLINEEDQNYITFFRIINNLGEQQPIGVMMINISQDVIEETLGLENQRDAMFILQDTLNHNSITFNSIEDVDPQKYLDSLSEGNQIWDTEKLRTNQMVVTGINNTQYGWKLLRITPFKGQVTQMSIFKMTILAIIILNGILVFLGSFFISRFITSPINKLIYSMKDVEKGIFHPVEIETPNDEIGILQNGYNYMIKEIQKLIKDIIHEQKTLKKAEFRVIMEQIKPHFLYNTLDSISSLIVLERNNEAYKSLKALGSFYRSSLSDGRNMVTIDTEIQIVKNYLFIQEIRYKDLFTVTYTIDDAILDYKVPKLILQPLVENSIYHGIRPSYDKGVIEVSVTKHHNNVILSVRDNGIGMSSNTLELLNNNSEHSVGIPATKGRIKSLYGNNSEFIIESASGCGTSITIILPWEVDALDK